MIWATPEVVRRRLSSRSPAGHHWLAALGPTGG